MLPQKPAPDDALAAVAQPAAASPAAETSASTPNRRETFILLGFLAFLLAGAGAAIFLTRSNSRTAELKQLRVSDNGILAMTDTLTEADLDAIAAHLSRYEKLGASRSEMAELTDRINQARLALAQRTTTASPERDHGVTTPAKPSVTRFLAPYSNVKQATALTTDGTHLYASAVMIDDSQAIIRISVADGTVERIHSAHNPMGLTVVGDDIMWIDPNSGPQTDTQIWRAPKNGGRAPRAIYTGSEVGQPILDGSGLEHYGDNLYAIDEVGGSVHRLRTDGSDLVSLVASRYPGGFATEQLNLLTADNQGGLLAVNSGHATDVTPALVAIDAQGLVSTMHEGAPFVNPAGLACGESVVFVADPGANNTIWCVPFGVGPPVALDLPADTFSRVGSLVYLRGALYVADGGTIQRIQGLPGRNEIIFGDYAHDSGLTFNAQGLGARVLEAGQGQLPLPGQTVEFKYRILLRDKTVFAESADGENIAMRLDDQQGAWLWLDGGLKQLRPGGRIRLLVPPELHTTVDFLTPDSGYILEAQLIAVKPAN